MIILYFKIHFCESGNLVFRGKVLLSNFTRLPVEVKGFLPFLIGHRRLESYARFEGIRETLKDMERRTSLPGRSDKAMQILYEEFFPMKAEFDAFFPGLVDFVERTFAIQIKRPVIHRPWMNDAAI